MKLPGTWEMKVETLMTTAPMVVAPDTPVLEARRQMLERAVRHLLVVDDDRLVGIVTDRDIRLQIPSPATSLSMWELSAFFARLTVREVMTTPVISVGPGRNAAEAARIMLHHRIGALPVVEDGRPIGIVTETDLVRAFVDMMETAPIR
jgi:acetoin utilization protein AcuB